MMMDFNKVSKRNSEVSKEDMFEKLFQLEKVRHEKVMEIRKNLKEIEERLIEWAHEKGQTISRGEDSDLIFDLTNGETDFCGDVVLGDDGFRVKFSSDQKIMMFEKLDKPIEIIEEEVIKKCIRALFKF